MNDFYEVEIKFLEKIICNENIMHHKLINYSDFAVDPQIKQLFNQAAKSVTDSSEKLYRFFKK